MDTKEQLTVMMERVLDTVQVAVPETHWKACRSKVLRIINDTIREMTEEDDGYQ